MEPKETCNLESCQDAAGVIDLFYAHLPQPMRSELAARKFNAFKEGLDRSGFECQEKTCFVLLQLLAKAEYLRDED